MEQSRLYTVFVTTSSVEEARRIAEHLVQGQLAACVNIVGPIQSVYMWEGDLHRDEEHLLVIKCAARNFAALERAVRELHSYSVPEVIAIPVAEGSADYLAWALSAVPAQNPRRD
ncbi:MAG: divalent-cation tolerance protein CutA [Candidatus Binatia bacterium]|nr:MAG: divalent-cation tolerance protein CutA [Candidatus Binatia bacterium]